MTTTDIAAALRDMLMLTLLLLSPLLATAMLASFVVGLLQASTRINDMTLSFVPRFVATMLVVYVSASWTIAHLTNFIERSVLTAAAAHSIGR